MIAAPAYDLEKVRADFPILSEEVRGQPIAYLDNAASSQKPRGRPRRRGPRLRDRLREYPPRRSRPLGTGDRALRALAAADGEVHRGAVRRRGDLRPGYHRGPEPGGLLAPAPTPSARGTRCSSPGWSTHSNIVPWQMVADLTGAKVLAAPVTGRGELDMDGFAALLSDRTRIVSVVHVLRTPSGP